MKISSKGWQLLTCPGRWPGSAAMSLPACGAAADASVAAILASVIAVASLVAIPCTATAASLQPVRRPSVSAHAVLPTSPTLVGLDEAAQIADWIVRTRDHRGRPFAIIDKRHATLLVFDASGALRGRSPVLLGAARGDHSVPGIGDRKIADIRPFERTTPAGRFETEAGTNLAGEDIVWIDYDAAVSMHRVRATQARERRLQRLASPTATDNRISYGCVNVPAAFYDAYVLAGLGRMAGVVYVLPEQQSAQSWFISARPGPGNATAE